MVVMFQPIILAGILVYAQTTTAYTSEINLPAGQQAQNYRYYATGQMKGDVLEDRYYTYYSSHGRVKGVYANSDLSSEPLATFLYDAAGNRLCKTTYNSSSTATERTWYLRDAGGTLLCYHKQDLVAPSTTEELPIPGVGTYLRSTSNVRYELTDHLGNTRVSFTYASNVITVVEAHDSSFAGSPDFGDTAID